MDITADFVAGCGRSRLTFLIAAVRNELALHLPELPDARLDVLADNIAMRVMADERDALSSFRLPRRD